MRLKIRTKLILSFFAPIIPLTVIGVIVSGYILNNLYNEAQRLDDISKQRIKVTDLRLSLDRGLMPVNDYIITGARKYVDDFNGISKEIEERFKAVEDVARTSEERELLKDVKGAWQNIREISLKILAITDPVGNKDAMRLMEEMDYKWGYPAIERLKRWREIDLAEYKGVLEKHNMAWMRLWTIIIIVSLSFPILCLLYIIYYSRQFVKSIDALKNGAKTIADGNLDEQIDLRTGDEIEELSVLFNSMADNLKVSYTSLEDRITVRTRELKESEGRYRVLVKAVPDVIFRLSKDGIFLDFKGEERELYVQSDKFLGKKISDVLPQEVAQQATHFMEQAIKTGAIQTFEYKLPMPEGIQDYEARLMAIEDGFLVIVRNITERKKAEEKLREQLDELERFQKVAVKREFRIKELQERVKELEGR